MFLIWTTKLRIPNRKLLNCLDWVAYTRKDYVDFVQETPGILTTHKRNKNIGMDEQTAKTMAKNGCDKLFDVVWDFLKFLYSGYRLKIILACLLVIWVIAIINTVTGGHLNEFGIAPRDFPFGFLGIFLAPFIHVSLFHAFANSLSFVFFAAVVMLRGVNVWVVVSAASAVISGFLVWVIGPANTHNVGASGVIFAYFGYILSVAFFERHWKSVLIAIVVAFLYGGALLGALPGSDQMISWQGLEVHVVFDKS